MNKKRFVTGLLTIAAGCAIVSCVLANKDRVKTTAGMVGLCFIGALLIIMGLKLSMGQLAKSVVKRLKESRNREKANRDRQRQARQNKGNSTSQ